ncbi:hypothetical protein CPC08DRAFT_769670 [Agrocybe pediades]|nr:hypothetical protein CPC08DRAFT_769670 [Agrocybe pediades]
MVSQSQGQRQVTNKPPHPPASNQVTNKPPRPPASTQKKKPNSVKSRGKAGESQESQTSSNPQPADRGVSILAENQRLLREVRRLKSKLKKRKAPPIKIISRPKGEAGNKKNGFVLREAMGLGDNKQEYNHIMLLVKDCCKAVQLDKNSHYRYIDAVKLGQVIKMARSKNDYLNSGVFPCDWPITELVKQYLRNQRKQSSRRERGLTRRKDSSDTPSPCPSDGNEDLEPSGSQEVPGGDEDWDDDDSGSIPPAQTKRAASDALDDDDDADEDYPAPKRARLNA